MGDVTVGVLALQGDVREHRLVLAGLGARALEVRTPAELDAVDALVLPGGESTTLELLLESAQLRLPLAKRLAEGMPALGTCAGLILLSRTLLDGRPDQQPLGAVDLAVRRNGYGRQLASFEAELVAVGPEAGTFTGVFIRAPRIESVGPAVEILATLDEGAGAHAVACRAGAVTVCAFHPELAGETRFHRLLLDDARRARGAVAARG